VILEDFLPDLYYRHLLVLVSSLHVLLSQHVETECLSSVERNLRLYTEIFEKIYGTALLHSSFCWFWFWYFVYLLFFSFLFLLLLFFFSSPLGLRFMSINFHLLVHLVECVREFGPLWTVSCFPFENANGLLVKCITGTNDSAINMVASALCLKTLREIKAEVTDKACLGVIEGLTGEDSKPRLAFFFPSFLFFFFSFLSFASLSFDFFIETIKWSFKAGLHLVLPSVSMEPQPSTEPSSEDISWSRLPTPATAAETTSPSEPAEAWPLWRTLSQSRGFSPRTSCSCSRLGPPPPSVRRSDSTRRPTAIKLPPQTSSRDRWTQ